MLTAAVVACLAFAGLCAAVEIALAEASRARLDDMLQGRRRERIDRLLERDRELALAANLYRVASETAAVVMLAGALRATGLSGWAVFGWAVLLVLAAAEILPRIAVARSPEAMLARTLPLFAVLALPALPAAAGLLRLGRIVRRSNGDAADAQNEAAEDILSAVTEGEKEGSIGGDQADMIENIIELRDVDVAEIMTPRLDMTSVSVEDSIEETIRVALESGRSRLPVFRETRDDIVGVLYVRDLIAALAPGAEHREPVTTQSLMRPPYFVPETMRLSDLLRQFQERETTLAIVVDEYGGTAGLVTIRDIIDMILGEVRDHDEPSREPVVTVLDPHTLEADARTPVRRLNEDFGTRIPESEEYDTVGGYLCYVLGRVPRPGDRQSSNGTEVQVLRSDERRVHTVRITIENGVRQD